MRRLLVAGTVVLFVMLPAATMGVVAYRSLRELGIKEDFYFEKVGRDTARDLISALEGPLYDPGDDIYDIINAGRDPGNPEGVYAALSSISRAHSFCGVSFWYPGTGVPDSARRMFYIPGSISQGLFSRAFTMLKDRTEQVYQESLAFEGTPRGFVPVKYQGGTVALSEVKLKDELWVMTFIAGKSGEPLGILTYMLDDKEYLREARRILAEQKNLAKGTERYEEIAGDLGLEVFFNLAPFNDAALRASSAEEAKRNYVYRTQSYESTFWGIRVFIANKDRVRINKQVLNSMLATLTGMFALIVLGIIFVYNFVSKEMELGRLKSSFVSNVSHELKTPLSLIRLFAETLELDRVDSEDEKHRFYSIIHNESERLTNLINNILDFSKIEEGRKKYDIEPADLSELLSETIEAYRFHLDQSGFKVKVEMEPNVPNARVDRDSFKQAVINLIDNALKYSSGNKSVDIRLSSAGSFAKVTVKDYGIGIAVHDLPHIFDKFYRAGGDDVYRVKGSGLGLAVVKHIMDAHLGRIEVWSEPGKGSEFSLLFPART